MTCKHWSSGHVRNSRHYRQTFDKMYRNLDSLKQLVTDTLQKQRMDSIIVLLTEKESNSLAWLRLRRNADVGNLYEQNIQREITRRDSVVKSVQIRKKIVVKQDTLTVRNPRKSFFSVWQMLFLHGKKMKIRCIVNLSN